MQLTNSDESKIQSLLTIAEIHSCGGSYDMVASWVKGKRILMGCNKLTRPAATHVDSYPEICGTHAELSLWVRAKSEGITMKGGTVYIVGRKASNNAIMQSTKPCEYCRAILSLTKIRSVVYFHKGHPKKVEASKLW